MKADFPEALERSQEPLRHLAAEVEHRAREAVLPVDRDDARRHAIPGRRPFGAELVVDPYHVAAEDEVAYRHVPSGNDIDDLVEGR